MALQYLALGDSYTIGEAVTENENFPIQLVNQLSSQNIIFETPLIIAQTGWTTNELMSAIAEKNIRENFDLVTLLIGVNNQYRQRSLDEYEKHFEQLLQQAIGFACNNPDHVIVISIPDWGITPFASDRDQNKISAEIDAFNDVNKKIAIQHHSHYIDITPGSRFAKSDNSLLASDSLHPSAKEYSRWAGMLQPIVTALYA